MNGWDVFHFIFWREWIVINGVVIAKFIKELLYTLAQPDRGTAKRARKMQYVNEPSRIQQRVGAAWWNTLKLTSRWVPYGWHGCETRAPVSVYAHAPTVWGPVWPRIYPSITDTRCMILGTLCLWTRSRGVIDSSWTSLGLPGMMLLGVILVYLIRFYHGWSENIDLKLDKVVTQMRLLLNI